MQSGGNVSGAYAPGRVLKVAGIGLFMPSKVPCYFWGIYGVEILKYHTIVDYYLIGTSFHSSIPMPKLN